MVQMLPDSSESDPTGRIPLYASCDGRIGPDPLALAGERPRFSLSKLALYLAPPALVGEFLPDCPWAEVSRVRPAIPWPSAHATRDHLLTQFRQSLATCIGDAAVVAVALSGGLDSTAVLFHAHELCQREGRRLLAVTIDLTDDTGQSSAIIARQLVEALHLSCELRIVKEDRANASSPFAEAYWHPGGPRNDSMPHLNRALADVAANAGAEVLLSGDGADELLGAVRYLFPQFLRARQWHTAFSYLRDLVAEGGRRRLTTEALAMVASRLPAHWSSWLYWATNWPELCTIQAPPVLAERYRSVVEEWTASWVRQSLAFHAEHHCAWAVADAWDAIFPSDVIPAAGKLPERHPFMTPSFTRYAMSLPLIDRYSAHLPTPYQRSKALVVHLYPSHLRAALPRTKQRFSHSFETYQQRYLKSERCMAYGLVSQKHLEACQDASVLRMIQAIEHWISGAEQHGATATE